MEPCLPHCLVLYFFGSFPLFLMLMVSAIVSMINSIDDIQENRLSPYGLQFLSEDQGFWFLFLAVFLLHVSMWNTIYKNDMHIIKCLKVFVNLLFVGLQTIFSSWWQVFYCRWIELSFFKVTFSGEALSNGMLKFKCITLYNFSFF